MFFFIQKGIYLPKKYEGYMMKNVITSTKIFSVFVIKNAILLEKFLPTRTIALLSF